MQKQHQRQFISRKKQRHRVAQDLTNRMNLVSLSLNKLTLPSPSKARDTSFLLRQEKKVHNLTLIIHCMTFKTTIRFFLLCYFVSDDTAVSVLYSNRTLYENLHENIDMTYSTCMNIQQRCSCLNLSYKCTFPYIVNLLYKVRLRKSADCIDISTYRLR